jgi:hypothetical protein
MIFPIVPASQMGGDEQPAFRSANSLFATLSDQPSARVFVFLKGKKGATL